MPTHPTPPQPYLPAYLPTYLLRVPALSTYHAQSPYVHLGCTYLACAPAHTLTALHIAYRAQVYMLLELALGGELFSLLQKKAPLPDKEAMFYVSQVVAIFAFMYSQKVTSCHPTPRPQPSRRILSYIPLDLLAPPHVPLHPPTAPCTPSRPICASPKPPCTPSRPLRNTC